MDYPTTIVFSLGCWLLAATSHTICASTVDDVVAAEMKEHDIIGVSLAIIENSQISKAKGYGFTEQSATTPVTTSTLFQAGSVSKPVAALGALRLVVDGRLSLDEDVNRWLKKWKVPESDFTKDEKVTLRRILSHSAGLTVHGFPGYAVGAPMPTLVEILDGAKPANMCRRISCRTCLIQQSESDVGRAVRLLLGRESRYPQGRCGNFLCRHTSA